MLFFSYLDNECSKLSWGTLSPCCGYNENMYSALSPGTVISLALFPSSTSTHFLIPLKILSLELGD